MTKRILIPYRHSNKVKPYEAAARAADLEPVSRLVTGNISLDGLAGLMLTGGTDVNPECYGQTRRPETDEPDDERDQIELELIHDAIEKDLPILAICRGLQILNVYHGGTLIQHLLRGKRHDPKLEDKSAPAHEVVFETNGLLADIAGADKWQVNSRHHQAVDQAGSHLRVSARDPKDNTIEGLERPDKEFVVAVQWHPEDQLVSDREQLRLFRRFAEAL